MIIIPPETISVVSSNASTSPDADNPGYMFDGFMNTQTEEADLLEVEVGFDNCDRVALFNVDAYSIDLELTDDDTSTVVQTKTVDLEMSDGEYQQWIIEGMYIYANATLKISINKAGGTAKCGNCGVGLSTFIGTTQYEPTPGFVDYSIKDTNDFGQTYLNVGRWAKRQEIRCWIEMATVDAVFNDLVNVRGSLVYVDANGSNTDFESLRLLGFIEDWKILINNPTIAWVDLSIQGVV